MKRYFINIIESTFTSTLRSSVVVGFSGFALTSITLGRAFCIVTSRMAGVNPRTHHWHMHILAKWIFAYPATTKSPSIPRPLHQPTTHSGWLHCLHWDLQAKLPLDIIWIEDLWLYLLQQLLHHLFLEQFRHLVKRRKILKDVSDFLLLHKQK